MTILADVAADALAVIHLAYFLFIVGGMVAIVMGPARITWVRNPWFRIAHLLAIYIVLAEDLFGLRCPLNVLQWGARTAATGSAETGAGVGGLLDYLLYHAISGWVLNAMYWCFGGLVLALLWLVPPRWNTSAAKADASRMIDT
jgi:hypothetical protein